MPRRTTNPFAINSTTANAPSFLSSNEKGGTPIKPTTGKPSRLTQLFSTSPKSKPETQTAQSALLAASAVLQPGSLNPTNPSISSASLSLPTISLSTATADSP